VIKGRFRNPAGSRFIASLSYRLHRSSRRVSLQFRDRAGPRRIRPLGQHQARPSTSVFIAHRADKVREAVRSSNPSRKMQRASERDSRLKGRESLNSSCRFHARSRLSRDSLQKRTARSLVNREHRGICAGPRPNSYVRSRRIVGMRSRVIYR